MFTSEDFGTDRTGVRFPSRVTLGKSVASLSRCFLKGKVLSTVQIEEGVHIEHSLRMELALGGKPVSGRALLLKIQRLVSASKLAAGSGLDPRLPS